MDRSGWLILAACVATGAQAQNGNAPVTVASAMGPLHVETSVSLGAGAQLTATRTGPYYLSAPGSQGFDPSATVLGSVRQSVKPWLGYSANFGYTRTTQQNLGAAFFDSNAFLGSRFAIPTNVYELSLAYLVQRHFAPNVTGFANLGGGVLGFLPVHRGATAINFVPGHYQTLVPSYLNRPLGVAAVGIDFRLSRRLALRAEYRGLLFKFPDVYGEVARATTVSSQPTVSLVYRFGKHP